MSTCCAWPDCTLEGTFPAPADPRDLRKRQYFCKTHIKEFNKRWNGLDGFKEDEIFSLQDGAATWNRPTWKMGINGSPSSKATFSTADDLYEFFKERTRTEHTNSPQPVQLPADVQEACVIFNLSEPLGGKELKQRYIKLIKQHHPDVNPNNEQAEEFVKKINIAFRILEDYTERKPL